MKMMLKHCQKKQEKKSHECTHSKKGFEHKSFIYLSLYAVNDSDNQKKRWRQKMKIARFEYGHKRTHIRIESEQKEMCVM